MRRPRTNVLLVALSRVLVGAMAVFIVGFPWWSNLPESKTALAHVVLLALLLSFGAVFVAREMLEETREEPSDDNDKWTQG